MNELFYQHDGALLQKSVVTVESIKRLIIPAAIGITAAYCHEQSRITRRWPNPEDQEEMDRHYITELCLPYNPPPDDNDIFAYYNTIRALSGTAGYVRIRNGFVYGIKVVWHS